MDYGHHNCRDYIYGPHLAPTTLTTDIHHHPPIARHESWSELEHRSRSPASFKPKFPLLKLPLEIRQQILLYLLPRTKEGVDSDPLAQHARHFSAVKKREAKGMVLPRADDSIKASVHKTRASLSNIVWLRGNVHLFLVNRQLHNECAELVYGGQNTFLLFLTYEGIKWRFRWLLHSGQAPMRNYPFLELFPQRYLRLVRRVVVHVDLVDAYTGMIKFNVSGEGLVHGLRRQVQRLVNALKPAQEEDGEHEKGKCLMKLAVKVAKSAVSETVHRRQNVKSGEVAAGGEEDVETVLMPLRQLYGVRDVSVSGAVTDGFARELETCLRSTERPANASVTDVDDLGGLAAPMAGLCVYGNDIQ
ncbi:hypothetical protein B0A55_05415 [Friedmanniomyces simplex]|uniref:F-box domain-containing protein n=1 Tax=Friedmanniomyces simplex TaxID=329884 RepID=A0A4U0XC28_9PEZI|nr:hypothetical protein B0A55_05415 [Friedmanniomyces simplex]